MLPIPLPRNSTRRLPRVSESQQIPVIRYERIYPERDPHLEWIDDYAQIPPNIHTLLATTGVQSIAKLNPLEAKGVEIFYRILPRESSMALAQNLGQEEQLCFFEEATR